MEKELSTTDLIKQLETDSMAEWSDNRRKDFTNIFDKRTKVSQFLLLETARIIAQKAASRNFISEKHLNKIDFRNYRNNYHIQNSIGDRSVDDLVKIAEDKAKEILKNLPPLKKAISIIDPETSQMIIDKEKFEAKGQKYLDRLTEVSGDLDLSDLDQGTTLRELKIIVKKREKLRRVLVDNLNELGEELSVLDKTISKRLYAGIPGLTDAVIHTIVSCRDKATAMGEVSRRVEEKVMFGDSTAAMEILQSFENDEAEVSEEIRAEFKIAMKKLKLIGNSTTKKKVKKKLTAK